MNQIIEKIMRCPECRSDLKFKSTSVIQCTNCAKEYEHDDDMIDFGVEEQKSANNWSGSTSEEELNNYFQELIKQGYFIEEDIANIYQGIDEDVFKKYDDVVFGSIRQNYYDPRNSVIIDLATGWASIFHSDIGNGMDYDKLKGKTVILTDLSRYVLEKVRISLKVKTGKYGFNAIYAVCDIRNLPVKDNSADFVSSIACFGNSDNNSGILREIRRVLASNRKFDIHEYLYKENSRSQKYLLKDGGQKEFTTPDGFEQALKQAGFSDININVLYDGPAKHSSDILPLKGENNIITLISAKKE